MKEIKSMLAIIRGRLFRCTCCIFRRNISIGSGLRLYKKLHIRGKGRVYIGKNCLVDGILGDSKQYSCIDVMDSESAVRIGDNACLYAARIFSYYGITIGDDVLIEEAGIVDTNFHSIDRHRGLPEKENRSNCMVNIGDRVIIGARSMVTKGVRIEDDVYVMPGAVVTRSIRSNCVVIGNPAKEINRESQ